MTKLEKILRNPPTKPCQPTITAQQENPYFDVIDYPKWIEQVKAMIPTKKEIHLAIADAGLDMDCEEVNNFADVVIRQINKRMNEVVK
ncbi:MAG: hypothetical protein WC437_05625 [Patescibacteria group bacterium]